MNNVIIAGRLGQDPELNHVGKDNTAVCNLSVATDDGFGDREEVNWHRVAVWGKQAEAVAQYLKKGSFVVVEGRIRYTTDEKDGVTRYYTDINARHVEFGPKSSVSPDDRREKTMRNAEEGTARAAAKSRRNGGKGKGESRDDRIR
jgi:single-strand DNA-binding protein